MAKLKVFRTTIGFHDAYVAAPSRAAALRAWGASTDLFAMGAAEEVIEPALMKAPLAHAGSIIKQSRGSTAEHMATASASAPSSLKGLVRLSSLAQADAGFAHFRRERWPRPRRHSPRFGSSKRRSADQVTLDVEVVEDGTMGSNEALGLTLRFESLHLSLSPADGQVRVFHPVIVS